MSCVHLNSKWSSGSSRMRWVSYNVENKCIKGVFHHFCALLFCKQCSQVDVAPAHVSSFVTKWSQHSKDAALLSMHQYTIFFEKQNQLGGLSFRKFFRFFFVSSGATSCYGVPFIVQRVVRHRAYRCWSAVHLRAAVCQTCCLLLCVDLCLWSFKPNNSPCGYRAGTEGRWGKWHMQSKSKLLSAFRWFSCSLKCAGRNSFSGHCAENAQILSFFVSLSLLPLFFLRISFLGWFADWTGIYCMLLLIHPLPNAALNFEVGKALKALPASSSI